MNPSNDSLKRAWELLRADSIESVDNLLLENRLMNEMKKQTTPRSWKRKLALAAALVIGFLAVGSGIAVAAGYNPFKTFTVFLKDGKAVITDEQGNPVPGEVVDMEYHENGAVKSVTVHVKGGTEGSMQMPGAEKPK